MLMDTVEKYQRQLLEQARQIYRETPITEATELAYLATPRHRFVTRYRERGSKDWRLVNEANVAEHAATLYSDRPLILHGDDDANIPSTISQPSFVLRMIDLLQLKAGDRVFELGAGSGWTAAMMGRLVGPQGSVISVEIIPEVAQRAAEAVKALGVENIRIIEGDGGIGFPEAPAFDRVIFTAGAFDLPRHCHEQVRNGGLVLVPIKTGGGGDSLFLFRKCDDHFESQESMPCGFVQVTGKYAFEEMGPLELEEAIPEWSELQHQEVSRRRFWWGGKGQGPLGALGAFATLGVRSFLGIVEPTFRVFKVAGNGQDKPERSFFGLWDAESRSLVLAKDDWLIAYGNSTAENRLLEMLHQWFSLGMPAAACLDLKVYPIDAPVRAGDRQWLVKRRDSQFLWTLQA
jgi:protein-L-isoaspartate(D-aspartate) O-methyltransferase